MNQILFTGDKNEKLEINKIVKVFCIIIMVFAIFLIVQGVYAIINSKNNAKANVKKPDIVANAEGSSVTINVKHSVGIDSLYYSWDNGEETKISANGATELSEQIELPNEDTTLNIRIIDNNKVESKAKKEFKYTEDVDVVQPTIEISAAPEKENVVILATDNKEISYIEYKWNDEETIKVENDGTDKTKLEKKLKATEEKKLSVTAYDASGNKSYKEIQVKPIAPPKVELKRNKGELIIRVSDEEEVTKVVYEINGIQYTKENDGEDKNNFEIRHQLEKGESIVKVTAYNIGGVKKEVIGKCTY